MVVVAATAPVRADAAQEIVSGQALPAPEAIVPLSDRLVIGGSHPDGPEGSFDSLWTADFDGQNLQRIWTTPSVRPTFGEYPGKIGRLLLSADGSRLAASISYYEGRYAVAVAGVGDLGHPTLYSFRTHREDAFDSGIEAVVEIRGKLYAVVVDPGHRQRTFVYRLETDGRRVRVNATSGEQNLVEPSPSGSALVDCRWTDKSLKIGLLDPAKGKFRYERALRGYSLGFYQHCSVDDSGRYALASVARRGSMRFAVFRRGHHTVIRDGKTLDDKLSPQFRPHSTQIAAVARNLVSVIDARRPRVRRNIRIHGHPRLPFWSPDGRVAVIPIGLSGSDESLGIARKVALLDGVHRRITASASLPKHLALEAGEGTTNNGVPPESLVSFTPGDLHYLLHASTVSGHHLAAGPTLVMDNRGGYATPFGSKSVSFSAIAYNADATGGWLACTSNEPPLEPTNSSILRFDISEVGQQTVTSC